MAVVSTLDFDDLVATSHSTSETDRIHRRFSSGVRRAPHRKAITLCEQLSDLTIEFARSDVQRAGFELFLYSSSNMRIHVACKERPKAHVVIDIFIAINIAHSTACRV